MSSLLRVVPPELTCAAGPLLQAGALLRQLADDRSGLEGFADGTPDAQVRDDLRHFITTWELVLWDVGGTAHSLGTNLRWAAEDYVGTDEQLAHDLRIDREGRQR